jgi:hypothetical protein
MLTLFSRVCHLFSPRCSARIRHIASRHSKYAAARSSVLMVSHSLVFLRSIKRSCRLRHAFGVLPGKCSAMGPQLRPCWRNCMSDLSSSADHAVDGRS